MTNCHKEEMAISLEELEDLNPVLASTQRETTTKKEEETTEVETEKEAGEKSQELPTDHQVQNPSPTGAIPVKT